MGHDGSQREFNSYNDIYRRTMIVKPKRKWIYVVEEDAKVLLRIRS